MIMMFMRHEARMNNWISEAERLYEKTGVILQDDIDYYCHNHYCIITTTSIILFRLEEECWFIHLLVGRGSLQYFLKVMPVYRPFVAWSRRGKIPKMYKTEALIRLIL